jgi:predicted DNA-binding mobile mystery protein A
MKNNFKKLTRKQLDETFSKLEPLKKISCPVKGWIKSVREAIGMTGIQLSKRLKVVPSKITDLEKAEKDGNITINRLKRAAEALDCIFVYAVMPKTSIEDLIKEQARAYIEKHYKRAHHSMQLEGQGIGEHNLKEEIENAVQNILDEVPKYIWDTDK